MPMENLNLKTNLPQNNDLFLTRPVSLKYRDEKIAWRLLSTRVITNVNNLSELQNLNSSELFDGDIAYLKGRASTFDGGGGFFQLEKNSDRVDDGGTVFSSANNQSNKWIRLWDGSNIDVRWFGLFPDGSTDCSIGLQRIFYGFNNVNLYFPSENQNNGVSYNFNQVSYLPSNKSFSFFGAASESVLKTNYEGGATIALYNASSGNDSWLGNKLIFNGLQFLSESNSYFLTADSVSGLVNYDSIFMYDVQFNTSLNSVMFSGEIDRIKEINIKNSYNDEALYCSGSTQNIERVVVEHCRYQTNGKMCQYVVYGAKNVLMRGTIHEGIANDFGSYIDPDQSNFRRSAGTLLVNCNNIVFERRWDEFWSLTESAVTIEYTSDMNNNPAGIWLETASAQKLQFINFSDVPMNVYYNSLSLTVPDFLSNTSGSKSDNIFFHAQGNGNEDDIYNDDRNRLNINYSTNSAPAFNYEINDSTSFDFYNYKGGNGIYEKNGFAQAKSSVSNDRVLYVQNHPDWGSTLVFKNQESSRPSGVPIKNSFNLIKKFGTADKTFSHFLVSSPYLQTLAGVSSSSGNAGFLGKGIGNAIFKDGFEPTTTLLGIERQQTGVDAGFVFGVNASGAKWIQVFAGAQSYWKMINELELSKQNYDCYEHPNYLGPPSGTSVVGDICRPINNMYIDRWECTQAGTSRPISGVQGSFFVGGNLGSNVTNIDELLLGDYIFIEGDTGIYRITGIDPTNNIIRLNNTVNINDINANISGSPPVWKTVLSNLPRSGAYNPSTSGEQADAAGQWFLRTDTNDWYLSTNTGNNWVQV